MLNVTHPVSRWWVLRFQAIVCVTNSEWNLCIVEAVGLEVLIEVVTPAVVGCDSADVN